MRASMKSLVVGALSLTVLVGTSVVSSALPLRATPGQTYCQCSCRTSNNIKDLDWKMGARGCNSNGKACRITFDGGKTFQTGTLGDCAKCDAQDGGWLCTPVAQMRVPVTPLPGGSLQRR